MMTLKDDFGGPKCVECSVRILMYVNWKGECIYLLFMYLQSVDQKRPKKEISFFFLALN